MEHTLTIQNLTKTYSKTVALNTINLELHNGIYGLLGHNGAGKSTLLNILTTTLNYDSGNVLLDGKDIIEMGKDYRDILGYMPQQQAFHMDMNVESFLYYMCALKGIKDVKSIVKPLLEKLDLKQFRHKRLQALSGGMKQRVLIAQALLNNPQILLLDEPTAGLDPVQRMHFRNIIADIAKDKIIIIATHVISDVELIANEMILMKEGNVLVKDTQQALLEKTKVYVSNASIEQLRSLDTNVKIVNRQYMNHEILTRFISHQQIGTQVPSTLDDVYLDWLG